MIPLQEQNHKKHSRSGAKIFLFACALALGAGALLYCYRAVLHPGGGSIVGGAFGADRMFELGDAGYSLTVPSGWRIERTDNAAAVYPAASACRMDITAFPAVKENDRAAWIEDRLGADPAVAVAERSSGQVSVDGVPAVRWDGTMDGVPAVFIYAFAPMHAYEIVPSVVEGGGDDDGIASCEDALGVLIANIRFSPEAQDVPETQAAFNNDGENNNDNDGNAPGDMALASGTVLGDHIDASDPEVASSSPDGSGNGAGGSTAEGGDEEECL